MLREQIADQGAAGYLEEGLLHSEAGQQNWWAMSSSSSSLPTNRRTSRERQRETEIQTLKMDEWSNMVKVSWMREYDSRMVSALWFGLKHPTGFFLLDLSWFCYSQRTLNSTKMSSNYSVKRTVNSQIQCSGTSRQHTIFECARINYLF